jgi:four helix bundle protein
LDLFFRTNPKSKAKCVACNAKDKVKKAFQGFKDLDVYKLSYRMAVEVFEETKSFPKDEKFSLVDQLRRSSRSVPANIAESWGKRMYRNHFVSKLSDSYAEANETQTWLDFSHEHGYLSRERHEYFIDNYDHICRMLFNMMKEPDKFLIKL